MDNKEIIKYFYESSTLKQSYIAVLQACLFLLVYMCK